jgi:ATP-dependent RNA helicase DOB1
LEAEITKIAIPEEAEVESYYRLRDQLSHLAEEFRGWLIKPQYLIPFLQPGRLVRVRQQDKDFGFGVIINFKKKSVKVIFF